jgi:mono/diheme cytochrome c family protein
MKAQRTTTKLGTGCFVAAMLLALFAVLPGAYAEDWEHDEHWESETWDHHVSEPSDYQQQIARGAKAWAENCSRCHNMRAISELKAEEWKVTVMHMRIRAGLPGHMARDIIAFLAGSTGGAGAPGYAAPVTAAGDSTGDVAAGQAGNAAAGQIVFNGTCVGCHGSNGAGAIPGVPNLRQRLGKSDQTLINNIISGIQTGAMAMPARGGNSNLTNADIANVVAYMKQKFR